MCLDLVACPHLGARLPVLVNKHQVACPHLGVMLALGQLLLSIYPTLENSIPSARSSVRYHFYPLLSLVS